MTSPRTDIAPISPSDHKAEVELVDDLKPVEHSREETAHLADREAHEETISQALRNHPWNLVWIAYGIWIIVCCSFDSNAGNTVLGIPKFREDYGYAFDGGFVLYAEWQSAFSGGPAALQVMGTFLGGTLGDKIGRKWMTLVCYGILFVGITVEVISNRSANPNAVFFAGKCINGFAIGALLATGMIYVSEISPLALRGISVAAAAVAFCVGTLVLALIVNAYGDLDNEWAYMSCFVTQYAVTGLALIPFYWMPESPSWCVSHGQDEKAYRSNKRLGMSDEKARQTVTQIQYTLEKIQQETEGVTYAQLFRKTNLRRTVVACMPLSIQPFTGVLWVAGYLLYYTQLAGFSVPMSYKLNICQQVLSTTGNITSWFLIESLGRRTLSFWGLVILTVNLFLAGGMATIGTLEGNKACVGLILLYCYLYNATIGATAFVAMSEIGTTRLRNKTASLAVATKAVWETMWSFVLPYLFNPNAANLQAKVAFLFGGFSILSCVYLYLCHPETKGRSFEEIDELFLKRVPARKFSSYVTEAELRGKELRAQVDAAAPTV